MKKREWTRTSKLRHMPKRGHWLNGETSRAPTRRLVLVDIENYCGKGALCLEDVRQAREGITREIGLHGEDLVVIGTSHGNNCMACGAEWTGPRYVLRHGHDGADMALIDASREYRLDTFSCVVIVSGDGIFTKTARYVRAEGRRVAVLTRKGSLSRSLRLAANEVLPTRARVIPAA